jgi:ABC-type sugar transport system ATPase subunit
VTALALDGLEVAFGDAPGLRGVSLALAAGERVALVGPSGVGKTTLLRTVAGFVRPRAGRVLVRGLDVTRLAPEQRGVVYLHQVPLLFPHLTVEGNVAFPLRLRRVPERQVRDRVGAALASLDVQELAARWPSTLSGGQRHRVALARAIVARPAALLLDEPFGSLDPSLRAEAREAVREAQAAAQAALLLVTHDLEDAGSLGDRIAVLLDGGLAQVGHPEEVFRAPASLAVCRFLGMPNEVRGVVERGVFRCGVGDVPTLLADGPAVGVLPAEALIRCDTGGVSGPVVGVTWRTSGPMVQLRTEEGILTVALGEGPVPAVGEMLRVRMDGARVPVFRADESGRRSRL